MANGGPCDVQADPPGSCRRRPHQGQKRKEILQPRNTQKGPRSVASVPRL
jgi:hypothetical protein